MFWGKKLTLSVHKHSSCGPDWFSRFLYTNQPTDKQNYKKHMLEIFQIPSQIIRKRVRKDAWSLSSRTESSRRSVRRRQPRRTRCSSSMRTGSSSRIGVLVKFVLEPGAGKLKIENFKNLLKMTCSMHKEMLQNTQGRIQIQGRGGKRFTLAPSSE